MIPLLAAALTLQPLATKPLAKPLKVFILAGQSNMEGHAKVSNFDYIGDDPATAPLLKEMRDPSATKGVWISYLTGNNEIKQGQLESGYGSLSGQPEIGPELTFGITIHKLLKEPVLLIKTAWGGKSIHTDFRPPSGATADHPTGPYYTLMVDHVKSVLKDIHSVDPQYNPKQGFDLAGFVWFQGWNDMVDSKVYPNRNKPGGYDQYSALLADMIRDLREDLAAPKMKVVIGVMGVGGIMKRGEKGGGNDTQINFRDAMAEPASRAEFKNNVAAVQTAPYWDTTLAAISDKYDKVRQERYLIDKKDNFGPNGDGSMTKEQIDEYMKQYEAKLISPEEAAIWKRGASNGGYHYLGCAKTLALIGQAFARSMDDLLKKR